MLTVSIRFIDENKKKTSVDTNFLLDTYAVVMIYITD